jgi:hypothetical protein
MTNRDRYFKLNATCNVWLDEARPREPSSTLKIIMNIEYNFYRKYLTGLKKKQPATIDNGFSSIMKSTIIFILLLET